jgi:hypothetical protein
MIFERLDRGTLSVEIDKLRVHVEQFVLPLTPELKGSYFGGWSVLSSTGDYRDGFQSGQRVSDADFMPGASVQEKAKAVGIKAREFYRHPTQICHGYLAEVVDRVRFIGLEPSRVRLALLKAKGQSTKHRDGLPGSYSVRLHIPIITNTLCTFECDEGSVHLPADGSAYILDVSREHQVFNRGETDRIVLISDVVDRPWVTRHHRLP